MESIDLALININQMVKSLIKTRTHNVDRAFLMGERAVVNGSHRVFPMSMEVVSLEVEEIHLSEIHTRIFIR